MFVIPAIDLIGGSCVRLYQGNYEKQTTYSVDPVVQAKRFQEAGFRRLHVVDLEGARSGEGKNRAAVTRIVDALEIPVQVGGGIRAERDVVELVESGVRYLIVSTVALHEPKTVEAWVREWGADRFILSLDLARGRLRSRGWEEESPVDVDIVLKSIEEWGIRQVICTDVDRDGTLESPNYETYRSLLERIPDGVQLIAAGGVSRPEHVSELGRIGVFGAIMGRALYEGKLDWKELAHAG